MGNIRWQQDKARGEQAYKNANSNKYWMQILDRLILFGCLVTSISIIMPDKDSCSNSCVRQCKNNVRGGRLMNG